VLNVASTQPNQSNTTARAADSGTGSRTSPVSRPKAISQPPAEVSVDGVAVPAACPPGARWTCVVMVKVWSGHKNVSPS